jgi:hypothetical protein
MAVSRQRQALAGIVILPRESGRGYAAMRSISAGER